MSFRGTVALRGGMTSNMFAQPGTGRWFTPPSQWTSLDMHVPLYIFLGPPAWAGYNLWLRWRGPNFSHYKDKNYYPQQPYTKEFIHKYNRLERWRWY